jgi:hypothetical protein
LEGNYRRNPCIVFSIYPLVDFLVSALALAEPLTTVPAQLLLTDVAVEKGTRGVISVFFCVRGERTFNNLRTQILVETPQKRVFQQAQTIALKTPQ